MPWTEKDVDKHFKGLSPKEKRMWCHVANGSLEAGDDDGTACHKANGVVKNNRIQSHVESLLYKKATAMIESVRMEQIAEVFVLEKLNSSLAEEVLAEADPKPRVEKDHRGKPVIPSREQFLHYFQDMQASHIADSIQTAHARWAHATEKAKSEKDAERAELLAAELKSISLELSISTNVFKSKKTKETKDQKSADKKKLVAKKQIHSAVNKVVGKASPLVKMLARQATNALLEK